MILYYCDRFCEKGREVLDIILALEKFTPSLEGRTYQISSIYLLYLLTHEKPS